jgi:general secretion pathway protein H
MTERVAERIAFPASRARRPRRADSRGVTLLELLIVLSIMAIVAAMVVPMFGGGVSTGELKGAARQVAAGLRLARSEALATRQETRVVLDLERRTFKAEPELREHALPREIELKLFTAQSDLVSDRVGAIRFFPDGGSNGGRITLAVGERKYDVDVDWLSGRVAILD